MHRFFADERGIVENIAYLNAEDAGHALRVLRLENGDEVELVCAPARYLAEIDSTENGEVRLRVTEKLCDTEAQTRVTLYQGLPKADNIALVAERNGLRRPLYIGDTQGDYDAASKAGVPFLHAAYGFGRIDRPVPSVATFGDLPDAIRRLPPP